MASQILELDSPIGISKTEIVKSKIIQKYTAKHKNGRRLTINMQHRVTVYLNRMQNRVISRN